MHGRIKVKTTAEQLEAKKKEQAEKLKRFRKGTKAAFHKREHGEYDTELLEITGQILSVNPDIYSFWNIRKETLQKLKSTMDKEAFGKIVETELYFLESCLRVNPKSYGTWFHRGWLLDLMCQPDWNKELQLCNQYLEYDERNFHCWDYRRFVVSRASVAPENELQFTTDKISSNFSNFSSWHYRSKLLPVLFPDASQPCGIQEEKLLNELELVQNAFFTDPNDQSAWFYHRWLLGKNDSATTLFSIYVSKKERKLFVTLSKCVKVGHDCSIEVKLGEELQAVTWKRDTTTEYANMWYTDVNDKFFPADNDCCQLTVTVDNNHSLVCQATSSGDYLASDINAINNFSTAYSPDTKQTLIQELDSCQQLHDLEPDNKWAMLTILSLMRAVDSVAYYTDILTYTRKLIKVDAMRENYYLDLESRIKVEHKIQRTEDLCGSVDLHGEALTCIPHTDRLSLIQHLDLSHNHLTSLPDVSTMYRLQTLNASHNHITTTHNIPVMRSLIHLDLSHNKITCIEQLFSLGSQSSLKSLNLQGNEIPDCGKLKTQLPQITIL